MSIRSISFAAVMGVGLVTSGCIGELVKMPIELAAETVKLGVELGSLGLIQPGRSSSAVSVALPQSNGYSQRGAFEDCARLYGSVSGVAGIGGQAASMAAQCSGNANRMSSLR